MLSAIGIIAALYLLAKSLPSAIAHLGDPATPGGCLFAIVGLVLLAVSIGGLLQ